MPLMDMPSEFYLPAFGGMVTALGFAIGLAKIERSERIKAQADKDAITAKALADSDAKTERLIVAIEDGNRIADAFLAMLNETSSTQPRRYQPPVRGRRQ